MFNAAADVDIVQVPCKGSAAALISTVVTEDLNEPGDKAAAAVPEASH